eukprot:1164309-Pleurochrysis_carterae.AAC.2
MPLREAATGAGGRRSRFLLGRARHPTSSLAPVFARVHAAWHLACTDMNDARSFAVRPTRTPDSRAHVRVAL